MPFEMCKKKIPIFIHTSVGLWQQQLIRFIFCFRFMLEFFLSQIQLTYLKNSMNSCH